ncbi:MAG: S-layer homology domain-containing protein [Oscillospiraceae bacterium]|jgi:exo-beta-1,3-glucanase (GH17 family)|nr:S-layer homology domain-containing protein [Oscillospiraceae bacterium]
MFRKFISLLLITALGTLPFGAAVTVAADSVTPRIAIEKVPAIDEGREIEGRVWFESSQGKFTDYAVTMALEVTRGGTIWGPKPYSGKPSVAVDSSGFFSCLFVSGGNDISAERLYVWLIPANFSPNGDFARTEAVALDKVVIDRYSDGRVEIQQTTQPTNPSPIPSAIPNLTDVFPQQKNPSENANLSICYSPYTNGLSPETESAVPMEQMRWQLNLIYPYADTIRLFGVSGELEKIYKVAKEEYHLRIIAGCWLDSRYSQTQIYEELDNLVELTNKGYVDVAVVGSETFYRDDFAVDEFITYIKYVRERITDKSIPVGTSDTSDAFLNNPKLVENCDILLCTIYPFFSNVTADNAAQSLIDAYNRVLAVSGGRQVIISESGWPTEGSPEGIAVPSMDNARKLFEASYQWSRENNVEIVYFSEIDEAWKVEGASNDIGGHWGHFTSVGMLKDAYLPIYRTINPAPVLDAETVKYAEESIQELIRNGVVDANAPSLYEPLVPITRGDFIHYLVKALDLEQKTGRVGTTFGDVDPNIYYYFTIGSGQEAGLVKGVGENTCNPTSDITRQDLFTLVYRALSYAGMELEPNYAALDKFADKSGVSDYARDAVSALTDNGLVLGDQNGNVNPLDNASRADAAVLLYRVYKFADE